MAHLNKKSQGAEKTISNTVYVVHEQLQYIPYDTLTLTIPSQEHCCPSVL